MIVDRGVDVGIIKYVVSGAHDQRMLAVICLEIFPRHPPGNRNARREIPVVRANQRIRQRSTETARNTGCHLLELSEIRRIHVEVREVAKEFGGRKKKFPAHAIGQRESRTYFPVIREVGEIGGGPEVIERIAELDACGRRQSQFKVSERGTRVGNRRERTRIGGWGEILRHESSEAKRAARIRIKISVELYAAEGRAEMRGMFSMRPGKSVR